MPAGSLLEHPRDISREDLAKRRSGAMVKGLLHAGEEGVMYGESRAGKSFVALDLAWHIAQGRPWHGRKLKRAPVLYVALEGVGGFRERMVAAQEAHGDPGDWLARLAVPVSLVKGPDGEAGKQTIVAAAKDLAAKCGQPPGLVILDTLARAIAGDNENDTADVMAFVEKRAGAIAKATGGAVLTVAHTNRAGDLRGSLHLRNAADLIIRIERDSDGGCRSAIGEKIKDGAEVPLFDFTLETVQLGEDDDGDSFASCIIRTTEAKPADARGRDTPAQRRYREAYEAVTRCTGRRDVPLADVADEFKAGYPVGAREPDRMKKAKDNAWNHVKAKPPAGLAIGTRAGVEMVYPAGTTDAHEEFEPIELSPSTEGQSES